MSLYVITLESPYDVSFVKPDGMGVEWTFLSSLLKLAIKSGPSRDSVPEFLNFRLKAANHLKALQLVKLRFQAHSSSSLLSIVSEWGYRKQYLRNVQLEVSARNSKSNECFDCITFVFTDFAFLKFSWRKIT